MRQENDSAYYELSHEFYVSLDNEAVSCQGVPFEYLAAERPTEAYGLMLGEVVKHTYEINSNGISVSKSQDGPEAMAGYAAYTAQKCINYSNIAAYDVVVSVFKKRTFMDCIRHRAGLPDRVFSFRVGTPPQEAS